MGILAAPLKLNPDGTLSASEQRTIADWLHCRLQSYRPTCTVGEWVPGQIAVGQLLQGGTSTLKRRYRGPTIKVTALVWGWLGHESIMGRLSSDIVRPRQGGQPQVLWQYGAIAEGGWVPASGLLGESQRRERLLGCLGRCVGVSTSDNGWVLGSRAIWHLMQMLRRYYAAGTPGMDLLALDVALLVHLGLLCGDCVRRTVSRTLDQGWWDRVLTITSEDRTLVSSESLSGVSSSVHIWYADTMHVPSPRNKRGLAPSRILWVLDLLCGFRSLDKPVQFTLQGYCNAGDIVRCIGLDIRLFCSRQVRGLDVLEPDICIDFLDDEVLPRKYVIHSIASSLHLDMQNLVHVHVSSPYDTNSRADASNRNRGFGYRDWHTDYCDPLPVGNTIPPHPGYTTVDHRFLAMNHDQLEHKLFSSLVAESTQCGFSFGVENPVGAMARKEHVQQLLDNGQLERVTVDHCNYSPAGIPSYGKATDYFVNFSWVAKGQSGDGRCGKNGSRTGVRCCHGSLKPTTNRWKHTYTIGQASTSEISGPGRHRKSQKNHLAHDECCEFLSIAAARWSRRVRP